MQEMWKSSLVNYTWSLQVSYLTYFLRSLLYYRACYHRLYDKKTSKNEEIELSSGEEDEIIEVKPKTETADKVNS